MTWSCNQNFVEFHWNVLLLGSVCDFHLITFAFLYIFYWIQNQIFCLIHIAYMSTKCSALFFTQSGTTSIRLAVIAINSCWEKETDRATDSIAIFKFTSGLHVIAMKVIQFVVVRKKWGSNVSNILNIVVKSSRQLIEAIYEPDEPYHTQKKSKSTKCGYIWFIEISKRTNSMCGRFRSGQQRETIHTQFQKKVQRLLEVSFETDITLR